ncbi:hypothetical protein SAMN05443634_109138 [Chishuiella changwenlii]|uniref:Uncharacterized protein n=1 Tax=Chishuiella changwenlii TaxID=1434701 RepID=A0A1M7AS70_9FLAO|nr:hypothetical protein [Chishuiella changwenlii]SHL45531.1 hypothetical protein SAMN05443634_109138 [Chishuiella changwenlii]
MKSLLDVGAISVSKNQLDLSKFDFRYITNLNDSKGTPIYYVYDVGYQPLDEENYLLFQE